LDSNPDWKQRYHDCRKDLDQKNLQLIELQKSLLKLSLGFIGRDKKFDKLLKRISDAVREKSKEAIIEGKLIGVVDWITRFTAEDKTRFQQYADPENGQVPWQDQPSVSSLRFSEFLRGLPFDLEMQAEIEVLAGRIKLTHSDQELEVLISEASALLHEYFSSLQNELLSVTSASDSKGQLIKLLEQINFKKDHLPRVNHAKSILIGDHDDDKKRAPDELVADLINNTILRDENLEEIGIFLRKTTYRLEKLHKYLDESELINSDHFTETFSFSQDLDEQFNDLRDGLENAGSITAMKMNIEAHLDFLNKSVAAYVRSQREQMKRAEETLGALNMQLGELRKETTVLKQSVEEEQVKSLTDALTAIANRRAYEERLETEISRWQRHGGHLSLMVFDLDHFKSINDSYGHIVGDKVLRGLTATFQRSIRRTDFLARYGGEEFVLILPETSLDETMVIADKLRAEVEQCVFKYQGEVVPVTVSIGVAELREGDTRESLFERADRALYLAKKSGRNLCRSEVHLESETT